MTHNSGHSQPKVQTRNRSEYLTMCDHCGEVTAILTEWSPQIVASCNCWCHLYRKGEWFDEQPKRRRKKS